MTYPQNPRHPGAGRPAGRGPYPPQNMPARRQNPPMRQAPQTRQNPPMRRPPPSRAAGRTPALGRVDPFCWVAAGPLFIAGIGLAVIAGNVWIGIVGVLLSAALVAFDARVNRGLPPPRRRPQQGPRRR